MKAKYIVIIPDHFELPMIFSEMMAHSDVTRSLGGEVVGAGFCHIENDAYTCYGESTSLNIKSRHAVDAEILNKMLGVTDIY